MTANLCIILMAALLPVSIRVLLKTVVITLAVNAMTSYVGGIVGCNHTGGKVNKYLQWRSCKLRHGEWRRNSRLHNAATACVSKCQNDGDVFNKSFDKVTERKPRPTA